MKELIHHGIVAGIPKALFLFFSKCPRRRHILRQMTIAVVRNNLDCYDRLLGDFGARPWKGFYPEDIQNPALRISLECIEVSTIENANHVCGLPSRIQEAG